MFVLRKPRHTGKTRHCIEKSAQTGCYIICSTHHEAQRIANEASQLKLKIPYPITFDEFIRQEFYGAGISGFIIDQADLLLQQMAHGVPVKIVTLTEGSHE